MREALIWLQVETQLLKAIRSGTYPVGSTLPTEAELQAAFNCSRHTVRTALEHLANQGYINRRPRIGSVVLHNGSHKKQRVVMPSASALLPSCEGLSLKFLGDSFITADKSLASLLELPLGTALFCFSFIQYAIVSGDNWPTLARLKYYIPVNNTDSSVADALARKLRQASSWGTLFPEDLLTDELNVNYAKLHTRITLEAVLESEKHDAVGRVLQLNRRFVDDADRTMMVCLSRHYDGLELSITTESISG
ncbi:MAG: GntR family transcriptional regulator [Duodenibacillus sp.]|nr:GntR family transcriptional regulator [Duodenibacillus sp.]